jgi:hypothetical protein
MKTAWGPRYNRDPFYAELVFMFKARNPGLQLATSVAIYFKVGVRL